MKRFLFVLALLILATAPLEGQQSVSTSIVVQEEGVVAGRVRVINCVGTPITCTVSGATGTITVTSGGGGSANVVEVSIDFGTALSPIQTVTVTGQTWVTASSVILCQPFATTADGQTVENYFVTPFHPTASNRVVGTGFDLTVLNPTSAAGIYRFHCTGA